jgi:acetylglutamate kinase
VRCFHFFGIQVVVVHAGGPQYINTMLDMARLDIESSFGGPGRG